MALRLRPGRVHAPLQYGRIGLEKPVSHAAHERERLVKTPLIKVVRKKPADAARLAASGLRLGVSTHCLAELAVAAALAPTYVALGPVFGTTSKRVPFAPRGLDRVAAWRRLVPADTPLVAIGGVGLETAPAVVAAGADAVAVISALGGEALRARVLRWRGVWEEIF